MQTGCVDRSGFLLAGGTDQRLRFWDLENSNDSFLAVKAPNDPLSTVNVSYKTKLIDGTVVVQECYVQQLPRSGKGDEVPRSGPEPPPAAHRDCISDIALCKASQCFVLTGGRDGVIKVWK